MEALQLDANDYVFPVEARDTFEHKNIIKAIHASQHTQRNYDRDKKIPIQDIKTIITAATQCPSKQGVAFYNLHVITNKNVIDSIYKFTTNIYSKGDSGYKTLSNPQVLANMLLLFSKKSELNPGSHKEAQEMSYDSNSARIVNNDAHVAVGIAAGYVNLTASLLGLETGCCACIMGYNELKSYLNLESDPVLLMGVGYKKKGTSRRMHALDGSKEQAENNWQSKFPTIKKESTKIFYIK